MARTKSVDPYDKKTKGHRGHREGSIYKMQDGRWKAQVQVGINSDGTRKFATKSSKDRKKIVEWLNKIQSDVYHNDYIEPTKLTVEEWFWNWMNIYKRPTVSANTYTRYILMMKKYVIPAMGKMKLIDMKSTHIQRLYNQLYKDGISYSVRKHVHTLFNQALTCAVNEGIISKNYSLNTVRPKDKKTDDEVEVFTPAEQEKLIKNLEITPIGVLVRLALGTGCRLGELLGLFWDNIDFENNEIHIVHGLKRKQIFDESGQNVIGKETVVGDLKTVKSKRTIPMADSTARVLKQYKLQQRAFIIPDVFPDMVFLTANGKPFDNGSVRKQYQRLLKSLGIPYRKFHALRHTYATRLLENNVHPKVAQELLGHSTCDITMSVYSHVLPEQMKEAVNKIKNII